MNVRRSVAAAVALAVSAVTLSIFPTSSADAVPGLALTVPANATTGANTATSLSGITLSDGGYTSIQVQASVAHGTLSMSTTTGLTFVSGQGNGTSNVQFTGTPTNVQAALATFLYTPTTGYTGSDSLVFNTSQGGGLYNPANGHFYEFVDNGSNISWTAAKAAADARTFSGLNGYLGTVTSSSEQSFVQSKLTGQGWLAASDDSSQTNASEGHWVYADGPENGQEFWQGTYSGVSCSFLSCTAQNGRYNNWASGEPNNSGTENFAHFLSGGAWNDFPNSNNITKYLVEYGGFGGTSTLDNKTVNLTVAATAPSAPGAPVLTVGNGQLGATWSAPTNNGGQALLDYAVEYSTDGITWTVISPAPTGTTATISGLTNGVAYQVRVKARNGVGTGAASTIATSTPIGFPTIPQAVAVAKTPTSASVSWATPASNGGSAITGYKVDYRLANGSWVTVSNNATSPTAIANLTPGTAYETRVTAINAIGSSPVAVLAFTTNVPSPPSISAPIRVDPTGAVKTVPVVNTGNPAQVTSPTPTGNGSWTLNPDGGIFTAGDAPFYGSMGGTKLNSPAVGVGPTTTGNGYFIVAADGGVFTFGDAKFKGSMGGQQLNAPITAIAPSCTKDGYYLVAKDGGVFAFGDAAFYGSMGGKALNAEMLGMVDSCGQDGYWTFAKDGGVFSFGNAKFYGSLGANPPAGGIIAMVSAPDGKGYWLVGADRHAYGFGSVAN